MDPLQTALLVFAVGAVVINGLIYGGITWIYFKGKHRELPPKAPAPEAVRSLARSARHPGQEHRFHDAA